MKFNLLTIFFLFVTPQILFCNIKSPIKLTSEEWISVELTSDLEEHLQTLSVDEKSEQLRDWVVLGALEFIETTEEETFNILFDYPSIRFDYLKDVSNFAYGEGRHIPLANKEMAIFVPFNSNKKKALVARQVDEYRMVVGDRPANIYLFEYDIEDEIKFQFKGKEVKEQLFSRAYGYVQMTIDSRSKLEDFIQKVDDLTYVRFNNGRLIAGGRQFSSDRTLNINLEELGALYQADNNLIEEFEKRMGSRGVRVEYNNLVKKAADDYVSDPLFFLQGETYDEVVAEIMAISPYEEFLQNTIQSFVENSEMNIGFSLDSKLKFKDFAGELQQLLTGDKIVLQNYYELIFEEQKRYVEKNKEFLLLWYALEEEISDSLATQVEKEEDVSYFKNFLGERVEKEKSDYAGLEWGKPSLDPEKEKEKILRIAERYAKEELEEDKAILEKFKKQLQRLGRDANKNDLDYYYDFRQYLSGENLSLRISKRDEGYQVRDVTELLEEAGYFFGEIREQFDEELELAVKLFQKDFELVEDGIVGNKTWEKLMEAAPEKALELKKLDRFLGKLNRKHSFQYGRYDGYLQGTLIGMNLYYTDLMMKLWSFDYKDSAPNEEVLGFIARTEANPSPIYWEEIWDYSSTRSWLGPLEKGFEFHGRSELMFSEVSTKIFNASSNDLFPGFEVAANYASESFSSWWNNHYAAVADYEPQFHKLNQIMKWRNVIVWMKMMEVKNLDFLHNIPVKRTYDFEDWYKANHDLKTRVDIPFLPQQPEVTTECIDIVESKTFKAYGFSEVFLMGGVTLPGRKSVASKLSNANKVNGSTLRKGTDYSKSSLKGNNKEIVNFEGVKFNIFPNKKLVSSKNIIKSEQKGQVLKTKKLEMTRKIETSEGKTEISDKVGDDLAFSKLSIKESANGQKVILDYKKGDVQKAQQTAESLLKDNYFSGEKSLQTAPEITDIIRLGQEKGFLCKIKNSGSWMHIVEVEKAQPIFSKFSFKVGRGNSYSKEIKQIDILTKEQAAQKVNVNEWVKITNNSYAEGGKGILDFTSNPPAYAQKVIVRSNGKQIDLFSDGNAVFLKNIGGDFSQNLANCRKISLELNTQQLNVVNRFSQFPDDAVFVTRNTKGEIVTITNRNTVIEGFERRFTEFKTENTKIEGMIFSENHKGIKLENNILKVNKNMDGQDIEVAKLFTRKVEESPTILEAFPDQVVTKQDLNFLSKIDNSNVNLIRDYANCKAKSYNFPDNTGYVNFMTGNQKNQYLYFGKGKDLDIGNYSGQVDINSTMQRMQQIYKRGTKDMTKAELIETTKPYVDYVEHVVKESGFKQIVTKEFDNFDINPLWQLHRKDPSVRFYRDQPDIFTSVNNTVEPIYSKTSQSRIFTPIDINKIVGEEYTETRTLLNDLETSEIAFSDNLTWDDFLTVLEDSTAQQLFLIVKYDAPYYVFSDRRISSYDLESLSLYMSAKEFIYIVSNGGDDVLKDFINTGLFKRVYLNEFKSGNVNSFNLALRKMSAYFKALTEVVVEMPAKKWQKLIKKNPSLFETRVSTDNPKVSKIIFTEGKLKDFSSKLMNKISPYIKSRPVIKSNMDDFINQQNLKDLERIKSQPNKFRLIDQFKGIIRYKVDYFERKKLKEIENIG